MKLRQLSELAAIVERGSLRAAARHLGVAQPGLTRNIRALEKELGAPLFERDARGMTLTGRGRLFYERASVALNELKRAGDEYRQAQGDMRGTVVAGLSILPHIRMLPNALSAFMRRYPGIQLKLIEGLYPALENGLRDGSVDFYLGASPVAAPAPGLISQPLATIRRTVVCRKGHPLAGARSIRELRDAEWATTTLNPDGEEDLKTLFARYRMPPPKIRLQANSAMSVMVSVMSTDLLVMLPAQWNEFGMTRDLLVALELKERMAAPSTVLVRRAGLPLTPAAEFLCDLMCRHLPEPAV